MDKHLHNIDHLFKDGIEGHSEQPSDFVWSNLDQQLDKREVEITRRKYRFAKYSVAAMALLTLSFAMVLLVKSKKSSAPAVPSDSAVVSPGSKPSLIIKENEPQQQADQTKESSAVASAEEKNSTTGKTVTTPSATEANSNVSPEKKQSIEKPVIKDEAVAISKKESAVEKKTTTVTEKKEKTISVNLAKGNSTAGFITKQNKPIQLKPVSNKEEAPSVLKNKISYTIAKTEAASLFTGEKNSFTKQLYNVAQAETFNPFAANTAQVPVIKAKKFKPVFSVAAYYSPQRLNNEVTEGKVEQREDRRDEIVEGEKVKRAFNYGVQLSYQFSRHWAALTGAGISKTTSTILPRNLYARPVPRTPGQNPPPGADMKYKINCTAGYAFLSSKSGTTPAFGDSIKALQSVNTLTYVTVPVGMKYIYKKNRFAINALAGMNINILTKGNMQATVTEVSGVKTQSNVTVQGLKPVNFSAMIGAGAEYFASNHLSVFLMPEGNFSLTTINKNTPTQTKLGGWGMQAGLRFSF